MVLESGAYLPVLLPGVLLPNMCATAGATILLMCYCLVCLYLLRSSLPGVLLPQMGLKLADLRAVTLPMKEAIQWVLLLEEEMFGQVRAGRAVGRGEQAYTPSPKPRNLPEPRALNPGTYLNPDP